VFRAKAAVVVAAVAALVFGVGAASAAPPKPDAQAAPTAVTAPVCATFAAANAAGQRRVVTNNSPGLYVNTAYAPMDCGTTTIRLPYARRALFVTRVDAEVTCTGLAGQWCLGRVLYRGVEGQPNAPEPDSFAWAKSNPDAADWESNSFTRTGVVGPCSLLTGCAVVVQVQVRNHAAGLLFRVDDSTVDVDVTYF